MNSKVLPVACAVLPLLFGGCSDGDENRGLSQESVSTTLAGAPIAIERCRAERSREMTVAGETRKARALFDLEYPSPFGISMDEHAKLTTFVDRMFAGGTNFHASVDSFSREFFASVAARIPKDGVDEDPDLECSLVGRISYADSRYLSYEMDLSGLSHGQAFCTFDRKLGRAIKITDLVLTNNFPVLRKCMREFLKFALPPGMNDGIDKMPADWPEIKEYFVVDCDVIKWDYTKNALGIGLNIEIFIPWKDINHILIDPLAVPTGKFADFRNPPGEKDDSNWWRFPYGKIDRRETRPPSPPFDGTNYPYASVEHKLEVPLQGGMSREKFEALQACLGAVVSCGKIPCRTIDEALHTATVAFWNKHIKECGDDPEKGYGIFNLYGEIKYRGSEYVSYSFAEQDGPPSGTISTNIVWNWRTMKPLPIEDVIDMRKRPLLVKMLRMRVSEMLCGYGYGPDLPDYAKDWPHDLTNFWLDEAGLVFVCHSGEIIIGGQGWHATRLSWNELKPMLCRNFIQPTE